jgi:hypothetical protein
MEGVGEGWRNDPNIVCTYELKDKKKERKKKHLHRDVSAMLEYCFPIWNG